MPIDFESELTVEDFTIISSEAREKTLGLENHVRVYGTDYKERLRKAGFFVNKMILLNPFQRNKYFDMDLWILN